MTFGLWRPRANGVEWLVCGVVARSHCCASPVPATKTAACQLGVTIEQGVVATYDHLMEQVAAYPDVSSVFSTLQHAAEDDHLPAFERCA